MARVFEILSLYDPPLPHRYRRVWLAPGQPLALRSEMTLLLLLDRVGDNYLRRCIIDVPDKRYAVELASCEEAYVRRLGLRLVARAQELEALTGRPLKVLVELEWMWKSRWMPRWRG